MGRGKGTLASTALGGSHRNERWWLNREWVIAKSEDMTREKLNEKDLIRGRGGGLFQRGWGLLKKAWE